MSKGLQAAIERQRQYADENKTIADRLDRDGFGSIAAVYRGSMRAHRDCADELACELEAQRGA